MPQLGPSGMPIVLSNVCSRWRELALDSSRLWCSVHVPFEGLFTGGLGSLSTWLNRSGSTKMLSLSADLAGYGNIYRSLSDDGRLQLRHSFHPFITILVRFSSRWKRLALDSVHGTLLDLLCEALHDSEHLPNISSIFLSGDHTRMLYHFPQPWALPNLRSLYLVFDFMDLRIWTKNFPDCLQRLTSLGLEARKGSRDSVHILDFLARCPLLEEFNLFFKIGTPDFTTNAVALPAVPPATSTTPLVLERLIRFSLSTNNAKPLLEGLTLPCLRKFSYKFIGDDWTERDDPDDDNLSSESSLLTDRSPLDDLFARSRLREESWSHHSEEGTCHLTVSPLEGQANDFGARDDDKKI
jgi:hypothetical protein